MTDVGPVRAVVRLALERDFDDGHEDMIVEDCPMESCDTRFVGANIEDYGVHLVEEHSIYRRSQRQLYNALARQMNRCEEREVLGQ